MIKWRRKDYSKLSAAIRRFNRKIDNNQHLGKYLPSKIDYQTAKENIATRRDFDRFINSLNRFQKDSALNIKHLPNADIIQWYYDETRFAVNSINARRRSTIDKHDFSPSRGNTAIISNMNLEPLAFNLPKIENLRIDSYFSSVYNRSTDKYLAEKNVLFKKNYIDGIKREFNLNSRVSYLLSLIDKIDPDLLVEQLYENPNLQISFIYDLAEQEYKENYLIEVFESMV